jgi:hypothetical protein
MIKVLLKLIVAGILAAIVNTSSAMADTWCHAFLKASDGTELQLDYQVRRIGLNRSPDVFVMANLYAHVSNTEFNGSEGISIVLMNPRNGTSSGSSKTLSALDFDGQRFSGKASDLENGRYAPYIRYDLPGYSNFHLEFAVVIDGVWLKDPVSGGSNFKFFPEQYPNMCANPF